MKEQCLKEKNNERIERMKNSYSAYNKKSKNSTWKSKEGEQWKERRNTKWSIKLSRLKLVQHCIQLAIAKKENFSKTAVTFLVHDSGVIRASSQEG